MCHRLFLLACLDCEHAFRNITVTHKSSTSTQNPVPHTGRTPTGRVSSSRFSQWLPRVMGATNPVSPIPAYTASVPADSRDLDQRVRESGEW